MTDKLEITQIEIKTQNGTKIPLSIEEAKDLHDQLNNLFGPKYVPSAPVIIERDRWPCSPSIPHPFWYESPTCSGSISSNPDFWIEGDSGLGVTYSAVPA